MMISSPARAMTLAALAAMRRETVVGWAFLGGMGDYAGDSGRCLSWAIEATIVNQSLWLLYWTHCLAVTTIMDTFATSRRRAIDSKAD